MKVKKTARGFAVASFKDQSGRPCSIQKSSLASEDCIWLGCSDIGVKVGYPWREVSKEEIQDKFNAQALVANNRMHLTRKQVKKLIPILQKFVDTGDIKRSKTTEKYGEQ